MPDGIDRPPVRAHLGRKLTKWLVRSDSEKQTGLAGAAAQGRGEEFAARGFDGAKVDRIAARARVNKAMLYYHFQNKAALYREILRTLFRRLASRGGRGPRSAAGRRKSSSAVHPDRGRGDRASSRTFPRSGCAKWPKAAATSTPASPRPLRDVLTTLGGYLETGRLRGVFSPRASPHHADGHRGAIAPLCRLGTGPRASRGKVPRAVAIVPREAVLAHVEAATLAALGAGSRRPRPFRRRPS